MKCISCGEAEMVRESRDVLFTYKGQTTTIQGVNGEFCPACDESIHDSDQSKSLNAAMLAFTREVNSASVKPEFISETRKKLNLDQKQAAELFGGGPNAFSRYETGKTKPPLSLVQLLKLLNSHPALLDEIRTKQPEPQTAPVVRSRMSRRKTALA